MPPHEEHHKSFPQLKYPSLRDEGWKDESQWLEGKSMDDGAGNLWRIHDKLYDLTTFIKLHPGGQDWLSLTKGTDITESFESHHIGKTPSQLLPQFYIKDAITPRNSPFTFREDGFYKTLKREVVKELDNVDTSRLRSQSKLITDSLLTSYLFLLLLSCYVESWIALAGLIAVNGLILAWCVIAGHNFLHRRDNWRMYLWNFGISSYRDARISHVLSHHMYPNTLMDAEVSSFEPLAYYLPDREKPRHLAYFAYYSPILFVIPFWGHTIRKIIMAFTKDGFFKKYCSWDDALPFAAVLWMYFLSSASLPMILLIWVATVNCANGILVFIGLTAGHHHPDSFHDGDIPK